MNQENYITTLSLAEQKALAVCGIHKSEQLQHISVDSLYADMQQAAVHFPNDFIPLSKQRLEAIYRTAGQSIQQQETPQIPDQTENEIFSASGEVDRFLPPLVTRHGHRKTKPKPAAERTDTLDLTTNKSHISDKRNAICNTHPFRTYFSALVHITMVVSFIFFLLESVRLIIGVNSATDVKIAATLAGLSLGIFLLYTRKTKCPVCNMNVFSMHNYPRNKNAHYFPLLGYTVSTALHVVFTFWFRCPACGTSQKLFKRNRR